MASSQDTHPFLAIHSAYEHHMIYSFSNTISLLHILRFLFFFSNDIMADVASKQQTTALCLSTTSHTHKKTHRTDKKNPTNLMGNVCCAREHSDQFFAQFFNS